LIAAAHCAKRRAAHAALAWSCGTVIGTSFHYAKEEELNTAQAGQVTPSAVVKS
jgi:hypothetical protein